MGKNRGAVSSFQKIRGFDVGVRDYILYYLGKGLLGQQQCDEARQVFRELATTYPESRWFKVAEGQVQSAQPCPTLVQPLPEEIKIDCDSQVTPREQADCFFQSRNYRRARDLYRGMIQEGLSNLPAVLVRLSQSAARSQDFETALWANRTLLEKYPNSREAAKALRKIAFLYEDRGDYRSAIPVLQALSEQSDSPSERSYLRERLGWSYYRLGNMNEAIHQFDAGLKEAESPSLLYWKARSLERLRQKMAAKEIYRILAETYGDHYYGIRALERIRRSFSTRAFSMKSSPGKIQWRKQRVFLNRSRDLERIFELGSMGFLQDALLEIRRTRARLNLELPNDSRKIGVQGEGFFFEEKNSVREDSEYPLPYAAFLLSELKKSKSSIDPFLLFAMMKQESRFRTDLVSSAGAIGLLQILPVTSQKIAKEAGWESYESGWLYDPVTNIELAVKYIKDLSHFFGGRKTPWYVVIASYNAGEQVVSEWYRQRKGLPEEEFIEEIPYEETRNYVKNIYVFWKTYRSLYRLN